MARPPVSAAIEQRASSVPRTSGVPRTAVVPLAVSARTAARLRLRVGDLVEIGADPSFARARRARVVAVWDGPEHPADVARQEAQVRLPLDALEAVMGREDAADRIVVRLRPGADPVRVRDDLRAMVAGADVYTSADLAARTSRAFAVITRFHRAIGTVTMLASGVFLVAIVSLKLSEMRRELGALRLVGIGAGTVRLIVVGLAAVVAVVGTAAGVALGAALTWGINAYYRSLLDSALVFARLEGRTIVAAVMLAVALGLAAGALVGARLVRRHPLDLVGR
ncbi:MAG: FtsX-like permease family protein [Firmicutes bacterium]|nr:FtsX-like permease family protein [Bacillota bacterium]